MNGQKTTQMDGPPRDIHERSFRFAIRIVHLCHFLDARLGVARTIANQVLRSGTSVGANLEEANAGESRADFIHKVAIALKEARETAFWLRLLAASGTVEISRLTELQAEAEEIKKVLAAIVLSAKRRRAAGLVLGGGLASLAFFIFHFAF